MSSHDDKYVGLRIFSAYIRYICTVGRVLSWYSAADIDHFRRTLLLSARNISTVIAMKNRICICMSSALVAACLALLLSACTGTEEEPVFKNTIRFDYQSITIHVEETRQLNVHVSYNGSTTDAYDTESNPYGLVWTSSAPQIASVDSHGRVTGRATGTVSVSCEFPDGGVGSAMTVTVTEKPELQLAERLSQPLSSSIVYSRSVNLECNSVMQCFDVGSDGSLWHIQLGRGAPELIYVMRGKPNRSPDDYMLLRWFGHGTNFAVEESGTERYIWVGSNGTKLSDGTYSQNNTVSRIKYVPGEELRLEGGDTFFISGKWNVHPAIDTDNDMLCITASASGKRDFYFYRLSRALATPLSRVTLRKQTYGGEESSTPQKSETRTIDAHDLTNVTPLGKVTIQVPGDDNLCKYAFQGFDIQDENLYIFEGEAVNSQPKSIAYVTILDMSGKVVSPRTQIGAIEDEAALVSAGICGSDANGYMEAEGTKMKHGRLYLGFASHGPGAQRWANVFRY